jgi:hypothetical protein
VPKSAAVLAFICQSLCDSFVFAGIKDELLKEVGLNGAGCCARAC